MEEIFKRRVDMTETYHGKPCKKNGHTERYVSNWSCVVCSKTRAKKWNAENPEKHKTRAKKWNAENPEKRCTFQKKYAKKNTGLMNYKTAKRRAMKIQQTPAWVDLEKIKEIYITCPKGYEVDHIHPLSKGGLHVDYNLQHLPISENRSKGTKIL